MKLKELIVWLAVGFIVLVTGLYALHQSANASTQQAKETICHATSSHSNPYTQESPNIQNDGSLSGGHLNHTGPVFPASNWGDIIPPYTHGNFSYPGLNWTTAGQAIWNNDCNVPSPTATPTPTIKPTATPTPKVGCDKDHHDYWKDDDKDCNKPTPTPTTKPCGWNVDHPCTTPTPTPEDGCGDDCDVTPTPSATPSATPTPEQNIVGSGNGGGGNTNNPPVCSNGDTIQLPANPFVIREGDKAIVNFFITQGDNANIYYKVVGQKDWQYSVPNLKPNDLHFVSYTITGLNPQLGYTFGIQQTYGCGGGNYVTAVIVDGATYRPVIWNFSYWEWSK